jgi:hypothetical protein
MVRTQNSLANMFQAICSNLKVHGVNQTDRLRTVILAVACHISKRQHRRQRRRRQRPLKDALVLLCALAIFQQYIDCAAHILAAELRAWPARHECIAVACYTFQLLILYLRGRCVLQCIDMSIGRALLPIKCALVVCKYANSQ